MFKHNFVIAPVVTVDESTGSRRYTTPNGDSYQSVTKFISDNWDKSFLDKWKKRIGEKKAASESLRATDRGQRLHNTVYHYLMNDERNYRSSLNSDPWDKGLFLKIKPKLDKITEVRLLEKSLYSDSLKLAGTPDIIGNYDNVLSTIDLKTSGKDKLEEWITTYWLQCSIYSRMYAELYGEMPAQSVIIMAIEDNPQPMVFIESSFKGQLRLEAFIENPVKFQEQLIAERKANKLLEKKK